jgi:hypothetical protein
VGIGLSIFCPIYGSEPRPSEAVAIFHLEKHLPSNRK